MLDFSFVLETTFVYDYIFDTAPITKLLLKDGVGLKEVGTLFFGEFLQCILVYCTCTFRFFLSFLKPETVLLLSKLEAKMWIDSFIHLFRIQS